MFSSTRMKTPEEQELLLYVWMNDHLIVSSSWIGNFSRETTVKKILTFLSSSNINTIQSQVWVSMVFFIKYKLVKMTNDDGIFYVCVQCGVHNVVCTVVCVP